MLAKKRKSKSQDFDTKKGLSVYLKVLLNYLQMISIIQSLELKWPFYVRNFLNVYSNIGGVSNQILSVDCLLQHYNIQTESIYIQTVLTLIIPFAIFCVSMIILWVIYMKNKKPQTIRFIVIVIVVSIFLQPSIIKSLFDNITWEEIDGVSYLKADLLIDCDTNSQKEWVKLIK